MNIEELLQLIEAGESETLEFKLSWDVYEAPGYELENIDFQKVSSFIGHK